MVLFDSEHSGQGFIFVYGSEIEAHADFSSSQDLSGGFSGFNWEDLQNAQVNSVL